VKGTVPSPLGAISVEWKIVDKTMTMTFDVPTACNSVTIVLPKGKKYLLNQKTIKPEAEKDGKAYFTVNGSGKIEAVK
jgi:hypothetical protein